jgi:phenylalanyl-tRNA synthetase alpha chain
MLPDLSSIKKDFNILVGDAVTMSALRDLRTKFLGKNGVVRASERKICLLPIEQKIELSIILKAIKVHIGTSIAVVEQRLKEKELRDKISQERIDVTAPSRFFPRGKIHPLSHTIELLRQLLIKEGLRHIEGSEIDSEWNNFTALNVGPHHPARELADTFYIKDSASLLRTHTSNVQVRFMQNNTPPFSIFSIGRVYRNDYDSTHTPMFHQMEALVVGEKVNLLDLRKFIHKILSSFFGVSKLPIRFRSSYFPFTEPSFEVDVKCDRSKAGEIKIGTGEEWLEILGCGMVHNNVFANTKINCSTNQGFALGIGIERLAMLKYGIPDLRDFYHGDIRWLQNHGF